MARTERTALLRGDEDVEIALKTRRGDKDASADDAREALGRRERRARESNGGAEASTSARGMKTARAVVVGTLAAGGDRGGRRGVRGVAARGVDDGRSRVRVAR